MKFYSEELNKLFDTQEELFKAEDKALREKAAAEVEAKRKAEEKKNRIAEVENAMTAAIEAKKHYEEVLKAYCKDYGSFHTKNHNIFDFWL